MEFNDRACHSLISGKDPVCDMADHFCGHFDSVEIFELIMNIPGGHPSSIEGNDLFFNTGNIPLVLGNEPGFKLTVFIPWDVNLEFTKLAFKSLFRMTIPLIGDIQIAFFDFWYYREQHPSQLLKVPAGYL